MNPEIEFLQLNKASHELALLVQLSPDISNFNDGFKGDVRHTYVLGPWMSSMFGFEIDSGEALLGVPRAIYDLLKPLRIYGIEYIKDRPGIFLLFELASGSAKRPIAIRIYMRSKRVMALGSFPTVSVVPMDESGAARLPPDKAPMRLSIKQAQSLHWER